jgi:hypothetical protein
LKELDNSILALQAQTPRFEKEFSLNNWQNNHGMYLRTDVGDIYLVHSHYLGQPHVNFKLVPKELEEDATGIIGQTGNMRIRLPNEAFEIDYVEATDVRRIISPDMYFPVQYFKKTKPCFTCRDKLKKGDVYVDEEGQRWIADEEATTIA